MVANPQIGCMVMSVSEVKLPWIRNKLPFVCLFVCLFVY